MGQEIVYCSKCAERLLGSDFDKGKAFRIGDTCACVKCAREILPTLPQKDQEALSFILKEWESKRSSSPSLPAIRPGPSTSLRPGTGFYTSVRAPLAAPPSHETPRRAMATRPPAPPPPEKKTSSTTLLLIGAGVLLLVILLAVALGGGRSSGRASTRTTDTGSSSLTEVPSPSPSPAPRPEPRPEPRPTPAPRPVEPPPPENIPAQLAELDATLSAALAKGEFKTAWDVLNAARPRHLDNAWSNEIDARSRKFDAEVRKTYEPLQAKAVDAARRKDTASLAEIRAKMAAWGLPTFAESLDKAIAAAAATPPPPPPTPVSGALVKALLAARSRDFDAAAKAADEAADQEGLKLAAAVPAEALALLAKSPRGWNLSAVIFDAEGNPLRIDEPVLRVETHRADVRGEKGALTVELGEIAAASVAEIFRARPAKKETDARAAAYFCAAEGDAEAAKRNWPEIPERVLAASLKAAESVNAGRETEARKLFYEAGADYRSYTARPGAYPKLARLIGEYGDTAFVRRNKASIQSRVDGGREYFFGPGDLTGAGVFKPARHGEGRVSWTAEDDVTDKSKKMEHYVELEFGALAETEYRLWVFAGACCQETFTFSVQATDLAGAEPGGPAATLVPNTNSSLKKAHASHMGKKEPSRWEWIQVPIPPKYAQTGPKKIRLLSDQQGFSIAFAFASPSRKAPPREAEAKDLEKARPALVHPAVAAVPGMGSILREWWLNVPGDAVAQLLASPNYPNKPSGREYVTIFEGPTDWADEYGTRIRGYLHPPQTGTYTFWTATDDYCDLYLSTSDDPNQRTRIAHQTGAVSRHGWDATPNQRSAAIPLVKGKRYYIELLHKEGKSKDHCAVGWQLPDGTMERPIPGKRLSPWGAASRGHGVSLSAPVAGATFAAPAKIEISAESSGGAAVSRAEAYNGTTRLGEAKSGALSYVWNGAPAGAHLVSMRVTDKSGVIVSSPSVLVRVGELSFFRAINFNGPPITIDGNAWEGRDAPNCAKKGNGFEMQEVELKPATDGERAQMIRSSISSPEGTSVTLSAVPNGPHLVYLYVWDESEPNTFDLLVKGRTAHSSYMSAPGRWDRLGPWPVEVAEGTIEVKASRGGAHFSGIEVWRVGPPPPPVTPAQTALVGGTGGNPFEDAPADRPLLVGVRVTTFLFNKKDLIVKTMQPLFQKGEARTDGSIHGNPAAGAVDILAKPGYAIGGMVAKGLNRVHGFKIVFMKISGARLVPTDRYESDWIGGTGGGPETTLAGDGLPVVGLCGRSGDDLDALGLIFLK